MISTFVITDCMKKDVIIKPSWHVHMAYFLKIIITQRPYTQFSLFDGYLVKKTDFECVLTREECVVVKLLFNRVGQQACKCFGAF